MEIERARVLVKDPHLPWTGPFPYEHLSACLRACGAALIGPASTAGQVRDAFFDLMAGGQPSNAARAAWDSLRQIDQRLVIDFLMYELPSCDLDEIAEALAACDMPVHVPDFGMLAAALPPDALSLLAPERVTDVAAPPPYAIPVSMLTVPPVDLGPVPFDILTILEDDSEPG